MKKVILFLFIFVIAKANSQTCQITFAGTGASSNVDLVKVENLTQCKVLTLGGDMFLDINGHVGINELSNSVDNTLSIYPNPVTDYCLINFNATEQGEATFSLYDSAGKKIALLSEFLIKGNHTYKLSGISSGVYVLKIELSQYMYSAKIVSTNITSGNPEIEHLSAAQIDNSLESVK